MKIQIKDSIKLYSKGQDKLVHPKETIKKALCASNKMESLAPVKLKRIDPLDRIGIPVFRATVPVVDRKVERRSHGKGSDVLQAKASALMEMIERSSAGEFRDNKGNFRISTYSELRYRKIALKDLVFRQKYYENDSSLLNELKEVPLEWTDSFSLTQNKSIRLPLKWFWWINGTNGMAAGNSIEEAILQGLCEVLERHTKSIVTQKRLVTPTIKIPSIDNRIAKGLILKFNKAGIKLLIKDFSLGLGIPTVGVLAYDFKTSFEAFKFLTFAGTSLNRDAALIRALIEIAQVRSSILSSIKKIEKGKVVSLYSDDFQDCRIYCKISETDNNEMINFSDIPTYSDKNFRKEIEVAVKKLADHGFEVIVTNITHNISKIPAVIVTILGSQYMVNNFDPYFLMPWACVNAQHYQKCINILERHFKLCPQEKRHIEKLLLYGISYKERGKYAQAIKIFNSAVSFCDINNFEKKRERLKTIYEALANCYLSLSKPDEAVKIYKKLKDDNLLSLDI